MSFSSSTMFHLLFSPCLFKYVFVLHSLLVRLCFHVRSPVLFFLLFSLRCSRCSFICIAPVHNKSYLMILSNWMVLWLLFAASPFLPAFSMCATALVHQSSLVFLPALLSGVWVHNTFLSRTRLLLDKGYLTFKLSAQTGTKLVRGLCL